MASELNLVEVANRQIESLQAAVRMTRFQMRIILVCFVLVLTGFGVTGYLYASQLSLSDQIKAGSIASCERANAQRSTDEQNWNFFMGILLKGNTNPSDIAYGKIILQHVAQGDEQANCDAEYS